MSETRPTLSRRAFLKAGGLALVSFGLDPLFLARAMYAAPAGLPAARGKVLVCLFQRGAVDGLSLLVPHGERRYYDERPRIAIAREKLVDLDGHFGLHPALAPLKKWYDNKSLILVPAAGSPDPTRSHFDAQDFMESGTPGLKATSDGWLNRAVRHDREHAETPFRAVAFGPELPRILAGSAPSLAIQDLRAFGLRGAPGASRDRLTRAFEDLYVEAATGIVARSADESFRAVQMLARATPAAVPPQNGAVYPGGRLGASFQQIAQLIRADLGLEVAFADVGGWDTHVAQGDADGQLSARLKELGIALDAFATDLGERLSDVVVLTMSEFGRTIAENGSAGTDHGHGTSMMLLGGAVDGGRIGGRWPGLESADRFEGRDVAVTTDFRDLFGEVVSRHLGVSDLASIFPGRAPGEVRFPGVLRA